MALIILNNVDNPISSGPPQLQIFVGVKTYYLGSE